MLIALCSDGLACMGRAKNKQTYCIDVGKHDARADLDMVGW